MRATSLEYHEITEGILVGAPGRLAHIAATAAAEHVDHLVGPDLAQPSRHIARLQEVQGDFAGLRATCAGGIVAGLVRTSVEEDAVVVAVRDRGCGIHSPDLSGVFEPFFTTKPAGLGMGPAICRRIVQAYGGRIWAANNEDTGATVSFSLPCAQARREPSDG